MITKDPDSDWVNWGMYRQMIHDKKILGASFDPFRHIGIHYYGKYEPNNRPMECAVAIGTDPVIPIITITDIPPGISEVDIAGGIRGEPVELVRCETLSLLVPANAEIVFEGEILPRERMMEGPFGEYTGYRVGEREPRPVLRVKAITHRNDPILTCSCMGVPVDDAAAVMPIMKAGELLLELRDQGFPVKMVYCPPEGVHHLAIVSTKVPYPNYASHLANAIWGSSAGKSSWYLMIVEDDVDVTNMEEVIWALTTRCHSDRGIFKVSSPGGRLLSFLSPEERRKRVGAQVLFDCTWPKDWPKEAIPVKASFDVLWPKEIQDKLDKLNKPDKQYFADRW